MVPVPAARRSFLPLLLLTMIGALWGSFYALIKIGTTGGIAPSAYLFWFGLGAGTVLLVIGIVRRSRPLLGWPFIRYCLLVGLVRFGIANVVFYSTQKRLPLGVMALIMAMVPIFTQTISIATRLERLSRWRVTGILCGFAGVVLIVAPKGSLPDPSLIPWVLFGLIAPFLHASGYVLLSERSRPPNADSLAIGCGTLLAAALWILPYSLLRGEFHVLWPPFNRAEYALIAHMILAGLNFYAIFELIRIAGPTYMSQANSLSVCFGVVFGMVLFGETHTLFVWAAIPLVLGGVALVNFAQAKEKA
jgi:drug/metabolite transporter (DMT)-like permease